ncbi:hypothetical protein [Planctomyces sp. SH-PL14]|uniref:hypothetical protein n=1 Tax=Planctomyces sp. SH-PL14 TaxID=1632864 RepID=UPI00078BD160|nr:hypothetical protein [Planctomyces sp. SH-PL14]AMV21680.1 hypothetical protein VT03_27510 [Planctomyces sp. SH-PL14]
MNWRERLRNAFAVPERKEVELTDEVRRRIDGVCETLIQRNLAAPAVVLLEMSRPMNYVGAQALHALTPLLAAVAEPARVTELAAFFEQRGSVEYVIGRLEILQKRKGPS